MYLPISIIASCRRNVSRNRVTVGLRVQSYLRKKKGNIGDSRLHGVTPSVGMMRESGDLIKNSEFFLDDA